MRLFIAINLNDEMKDALLDLQDGMMDRGIYGNYTREENMHLTLAFIGEYGDPEAVREAIERVRFKPFDIRLDGLGSFGSLWWAGVKTGRAPAAKGRDGAGKSGYDPLLNLAKKLRRELANAGIPFDRKRFSPHITLVRKAEYEEGFSLDDVWKSAAGSGIAAGMRVDHFSLMRSDRGKYGMIYTEI